MISPSDTPSFPRHRAQNTNISGQSISLIKVAGNYEGRFHWKPRYQENDSLIISTILAYTASSPTQHTFSDDRRFEWYHSKWAERILLRSNPVLRRRRVNWTRWRTEWIGDSYRRSALVFKGFVRLSFLKVVYQYHNSMAVSLRCTYVT